VKGFSRKGKEVIFYSREIFQQTEGGDIYSFEKGVALRTMGATGTIW